MRKSAGSKLSPNPAGEDATCRPGKPKETVMKKRVECECGWKLETDDEEKLVKGVQEHASEVHHMQGVTREQVLAQAKPV
jgi:predicted small metal-binding protein